MSKPGEQLLFEIKSPFLPPQPQPQPQPPITTTTTMGAAYTIFGKQVPSYILSLATLGSVAAVAIVPQFVGSKETQAAAAAAPAAQTKEDDFDLEKLLNDLTKEETK